MFNLHHDAGYDNGAHLPSWSQNAVMARTSPTTGSMSDYDQRQLAHSFSTSGEIGIRPPTWESSASGGISSTPQANQRITQHYIVNQVNRKQWDVFPEELGFSVNFRRARSHAGGATPLTMKGLSQLRRWLRSDDEQALELGMHESVAAFSMTVAYIGSLLTKPGTTGRAFKKNNEAWAVAGVTRLKDVWACQDMADDALCHGERLFLAVARRTKRVPLIMDASLNMRLVDPRYEWTVDPVSSFDNDPPWWTYLSLNDSGVGVKFQGKAMFVGMHMRDLDQTSHGVKEYASYATTYLENNDPEKAMSSYIQLRSIEVHMSKL